MEQLSRVARLRGASVSKDRKSATKSNDLRRLSNAFDEAFEEDRSSDDDGDDSSEGNSEDEDNFSDSVSDTLSEGGGDGSGSDVGLQAALLNSVWTVLNRVIMLGVADAEVEVRHSIFANLSANTDQFILRSNTLSLVYVSF